MIFYDFLYKYAGDDYKHLPGLIRRHLVQRLINTLKKLDIDAKIKWPNDIYINNKKVSGILTEMKCDMDRIHYLIVGIGINVNLEKNDFPQDILDIATSLKIENV